MKNSKHSDRILLLGFGAFLLLGLALHLLLPDRAYSENENRYLAQLPRFSFSRLADGSFTRDVESYITDQFPLRDRWLDLKSRAERAIGKTENNGVFLCGGDTLITRVPEPTQEELQQRIEALQALDANTETPILLSLIPTAAEIWADRLPAHANTAGQAALIRQIAEGCGLPAVDLCAALRPHADEAIYYRTDHHWTTLGAYYGYAATAAALGLTPRPLSDYEPETVSTSFYGTVYSSSGVRWVEPDSIQVFVPAEAAVLTRYESAEGTPSPIYDRSKLDTKDEYSMFLGGNIGRAVIDTGAESGKLLVLRDSYSDCELPFFFQHYAQIHVLDLRYYRQSLSAYLAEQDFDAILVNYSLSGFLSDSAVTLLAG